MVKKKVGVGVIERAAAILRILGDAPEGLSLGKIAQRVGLARSTVQRIIGMLEAERLVVSGSQPGRIMLGPELLRLARLAFPTIINRIRPLMESLSSEIDETVYFGTISKDEMVILDQVAGQQRVIAVSHIGDSIPHYCSSVGKAYLATMNAEQIERLIGVRYERRTPNTLTDLPALLADIESCRNSGIGLDIEEHALGICAAGFCFRDEADNWFGLSVPIPTQRFVVQRAKLIKCMTATRFSILQ